MEPETRPVPPAATDGMHGMQRVRLANDRRRRPYLKRRRRAMPVEQLREYLDKNRVKYVVISHSPAYTAQEIAASAHIPGHELAKTVVVKVDGKLAMAVLPASSHVNLDLLAESIGVDRIDLADEFEFRHRFGDCELGAMPPFGNLYGMDVYVSDELTIDDQIAFNAGSHTELIQLAFEDFERLANPKIMRFAVTA
jgi:Ala-tRNA(Pro) deacylase